MMQCKASFHVDKHYSRRHNMRDYDAAEWNKDGHIDAARSSQNVVLVDKSLRKFFDEVFGEAIEEANEKNRKKHLERCTTVAAYYAEYHGKAQEAIVQIGDGTTYQEIVLKYGQEKADDFYKTALGNAFEKFKEENPSLKVFGAYIHMDETTPHLHLDFLPVAEYKRGQKLKVSLEGALKEVGFARSKSDKFGENPYQRWLGDRRPDFENFHQKQVNELLGKDVLEILPSEKSTRPHLETWQWKQQQLEAQLTDLTQQKNSLQSDVEQSRASVEQAKKTQSEIRQDTEKLKREAEQAKAEKLMTIQIPPRPNLPEKPEKPKEPWYGSKADEKQHKKDLKEYEKQLKQWERDAPLIQQAQVQWDNDYNLLAMLQDTQKKQQQTAQEQAQRADAITQQSKTLQQERAAIPQQIEAAVQDRLKKAEQFTKMMEVSQSWKDRYQQAFGKPYIDTREEQNRDAGKNDKTEHDAGLWEHGD